MHLCKPNVEWNAVGGWKLCVDRKLFVIYLVLCKVDVIEILCVCVFDGRLMCDGMLVCNGVVVLCNGNIAMWWNVWE